MLSLGIEASLAFCTARPRAALVFGSPPPSFAATVMARASFVKSLPRRASTIAFLCLIPAHLECPAMGVSLGCPADARSLRDLQGLRRPRPLRRADRRRRRRAGRPRLRARDRGPL